jgi:hypothetical protein
MQAHGCFDLMERSKPAALALTRASSPGSAKHQEVERVVTEQRPTRTSVLKQVEAWLALIGQSDQLSLDHSFCKNVLQAIGDVTAPACEVIATG